MPRLSLKQIKEELEKKTTLDEKKNYLLEILKKIKSPKLKAKVEELLKETEKHLAHEEKFSKEKLEQKITSAVPEAAGTPVGKAFSEVKYIPRVQREAASGLEKEVRSVNTGNFSKFADFGAPKYIALAGGGYMSSREAADRARLLLEDRGLMHRVSADEFYRMSPVQKQSLMKTVSEAIGTPLENYEQLYTLTKSIAIKPEEQKYKTKKW